MERSDAASANPRFALFDSLRAIAALLVFAFHALFFLGYLFGGNPARVYVAMLNVGVTIFFLISGFLLYRPFVFARWHRAPALPALPFLARRGLRIFPAYWLVLVVATLAVGLPGVFSLDGLLHHFTLLKVYDRQHLLGGIGHAWTLSVEITFYALLPLWAFAVRRAPFRSLRGFLATELGVLVAVFALSVVWKLTAYEAAPDGTLVFSPAAATLPAFLDHFALGMALAVVSVTVADRSRAPAAVGLVERFPALPWALAALLFVLAGLVAPAWNASDELVRHEFKGAVALGVLLPAVFGDPRRGAVRRLLAHPALLWVGIVSYGVYLWHPIIMWRLQPAQWDGVAAHAGFVVVCLALTLAAAAASFYGIERHALRLGRRISRRRTSQDADRRDAELRAAAEPSPAAGP